MAVEVSINQVILPHSTALKRNPFIGFRTSDGGPLTDDDYAQYDDQTVFFDVFFDTANKRLMAVGPPFLNLEKSLLPISAELNGKAVPVSLTKSSFRQFSLLTADVSDHLVTDLNDVTLHFGQAFCWTGTIPRNTFASEATITLATQQKNNRIRWITDYIHYYRTAHGVERFFIYDNGSDYQDGLATLLPDDVYLIRWPFKHGPIHSHGNKFGQVGSMTHTIHRFGSAGYCLNFDIDELLVMKGGRKFIDYLRKYALVHVHQYRVPFVALSTDDYSFANFEYRERELYKGAPKYGYSFADIELTHWHDAVLRSDLLRYKLPAIGIRADYWIRARLGYSQYGKAAGPFGIFSRVFRKTLKALRIRYALTENEGYFLHFKGITTNWKVELENRFVPTANNDNLVFDDSVKKRFVDASIVSK